MTEYKRKCSNSDCNKETIYKYKSTFDRANKGSGLCLSCAVSKIRIEKGIGKGKDNPFYGKKHSMETKQKMSKNHADYSGKNNFMYGKKHTEQSILKNSLSQRGEKSHNFSKKASDETKRKIRVAVLNRMARLGILPAQDEGAFEYFYDFSPSIITDYYLKDLGYVLDGYDLANNVVYEYDTRYHRGPVQKEKDLVRQNNIIEYFKQIDNPLNSFIRINSETKKQTEVHSNMNTKLNNMEVSNELASY